MRLARLVRELSEKILVRLEARKPLLVTFSGAQGCGKTTVCEKLRHVLEDQGFRTRVLALDDFYLTKNDRKTLADKIHPLCSVRGVPGTHDLKYLKKVIRSLLHANENSKVRMPSFSKAADDRRNSLEFIFHNGCVDVILLEGWCVGARSSFVQSLPENDWEIAKDPFATWKVWTKNAAIQYETIWRATDFSVLLLQSDFERTVDDRWRQEKELLKASGSRQFQSRREVLEFCNHYRSWTVGMCDHFPKTADLVVECLEDFVYKMWEENKLR